MEDCRKMAIVLYRCTRYPEGEADDGWKSCKGLRSIVSVDAQESDCIVGVMESAEVMSMLNVYKTSITKAAKVLRNKITELDKAILEPLDLTTEAGKDPQLVLSRKSLLFFHSTTLGRAVDTLRAHREKAEEFARQHPDESGEFPFLQQIQDHWDANELDELVEEAETLRDRVDAAIKLLTLAPISPREMKEWRSRAILHRMSRIVQLTLMQSRQLINPHRHAR
ncbi:unnamed protein product [Cylicostephanus goldi]|uniref:Uncharacterized protein n=1 Tax=Cylicostephanus goldi TaxID=71465 RepID=A0A3P7M050_CYLGO|nr:unnamed protein product [Cylicostephanus goldi]